MGYTFLEFMKGIGIFIICAQSFMHFSAGKSYEKYIKLLIGVMILAQFVVPVRAVFLKGEDAEIWGEIEHFQNEMENVLENTEITYESEDETEGLLEDEIKNKLSDTAKQYGYAVDEVRVYEDPPKLIIAVIQNTSEGEKIRVKQVKVETKDEKDGIDQDTESYGQTAGKGETEEMKKRFGIVLGIDESYIEIHIG